ncbi:MAG TPA: tetrahydrofolate dehydrogenase/cyclohydrolase catalytic domain-containing protein [Oligoflexia bacterium]|nr:tetrahydrofolate dehydrogenase/cyclohydrolase catalytic domain-containing protein [Oligoflexia bacterium]HMP48615.1 tetrahydrofolate dehydrogenase/cyclohydrolase catalytic domain-containing protein [Oligoflexia bacterium]
MDVNPANVAERFRTEVRSDISAIYDASGLKLKLVGLLAGDDPASRVYSDYTRVGCEDVGVIYEAREVSRTDLERTIRELNADNNVTGIIVYYPVFGGARDAHLRSVLSPLKDIEGLHPFWLERLYSNKRILDGITSQKIKALLPCTPLAILKLLEAAGEMTNTDSLPFSGKKVSIFNRSEVVGRPLAHMLSNDGAEVFSFDIDGLVLFSPGGKEEESKMTRAEALRQSDIVITGVPSNDFDVIRSEELGKESCCLNFSSFRNFSEDVPSSVKTFIPRVGPVTVAMCLRNLLRVYKQFSGCSQVDFPFS